MSERIHQLREAERALMHALSLTESDHPTKGNQGINDEWSGIVRLIVKVGLLADKLEREADDVEGADVLPDDPNLWHGSARSEQGLWHPIRGGPRQRPVECRTRRAHRGAIMIHEWAEALDFPPTMNQPTRGNP